MSLYKLKSVKLWLMLSLVFFVGMLNLYGTVDGRTYIDFIKWAFGIFVAGNVGAKVASKKVE